MTAETSITDRLTKVGQTYAQPLFSLGLEQNIIDDVKTDLDALIAFGADESDFLSFLASPYFDAGCKKQLIEKVFRDRLTDLTMNFLMVVIKNERAFWLPSIIEAYSRIWFANYQCCQVTATVSEPISEQQVRNLNNRIAVAIRENIEFKVVVDKSIIGGIIIRYGDKVINNSVKSRLTAAVKTIINRCMERGRIDEI